MIMRTSNIKNQIKVTEETLSELGCSQIPVIYVMNKADLCMEDFPKVQGDNRIYMAAGSGRGLEELTELIGDKLFWNLSAGRVSDTI